MDCGFKNKTQINNYALKDILTYSILIKITNTFALHSVCYEIATNIKNGGMSSLLLKPQNIFLYFYAKIIGTRITELLCSLFLFIALLPLYYKFIFWQTDIVYLIMFLLSIIIASVLSYIFGVFVGILAFWIQEVYAVMWSVFVIINFLSGQFIPLDFFPSSVRYAIEYLPFSSFGYFPLSIYLGKASISEILLHFFVFCVWTIIMLVFTYLIWKKGIKLLLPFFQLTFYLVILMISPAGPEMRLLYWFVQHRLSMHYIEALSGQISGLFQTL